MLLGPLKAVVMKVLQQQLSKYIHNIELEELGLMGGDVVLENLGAMQPYTGYIWLCLRLSVEICCRPQQQAVCNSVASMRLSF